MKRSVLFFVGVLALLISGATLAQEAPTKSDFTFRRVKVPGAASGNRITVQIDPVAQAAYLAVPKPPEIVPIVPLPEPAETAFGWYWAGVSPSLAEQSAGRLDLAVRFLTGNPNGKTVPAPRLQTLQQIADSHGVDILRATVGTRVSPALVLAIIGIESSGRVEAVSSAGAVGLMQLIPATAERFGVKNSADPAENIKGGVAYLDWLMKEFSSDPVIVLAAYNAGEGAVRRHEGVPPYDETRAYVPKVLATWTVARNLCVTPPELISDGCVFAVREARNDG